MFTRSFQMISESVASIKFQFSKSAVYQWRKFLGNQFLCQIPAKIKIRHGTMNSSLDRVVELGSSDILGVCTQVSH